MFHPEYSRKANNKKVLNNLALCKECNKSGWCRLIPQEELGSLALNKACNIEELDKYPECNRKALDNLPANNKREKYNCCLSEELSR